MLIPALYEKAQAPEWQSGSKLTPAPYEKAQTSEEMIYLAERLQHTYSSMVTFLTYVIY